MSIGSTEVEPQVAQGAASAVARPRFFYGWRLVGAAFVASFTTAGVQAYVAGAFFVPMSDDLGWTRAQFLYGQTV
ncbi:MAG TPA: hypothetical protein PLX85_04435, partial [Dehalococcoidia bacterium]|nr:hypothetical protein [Dehalococcoidia bacterium]